MVGIMVNLNSDTKAFITTELIDQVSLGSYGELPYI